MKRVLLLRHAKSDWGAGATTDHERPLSERGRKAAARIGRFLAAIDQIPDQVISSTAVRARTTAEVAAEAGGWGSPLRVTEKLYDGTADIVLAELRQLPTDCDSVLIVGHEPTGSECASRLIGRAGLKMVTAALARIDFADERWAEVDFGRGTLSWMVTPKLLAWK